MLTTLRANADDPGTLRAIQQLLFSEVARAERKIRELKANLRSIQESGGHAAAKRSSYLKGRIERLRQVAYVWRCFGDGIAFLYMDKFALKQCFYHTDHPGPKQSAGFVSDKLGVANEIALVETALQRNIPALLVDLTDTIRHGDVCLMGGADPYLIEVKTSSKLNSRGKRQRRALKQLHEFFDTDKGLGLRGFPDVRRVAFELPELTYTDELNECITTAIESGYAVRNPEPGLFYVAMATKTANVERALHSLDLKAPWIFDLNAVKLERAWAPYLPFTLSIQNQENLWRFVRGDVYLLVLLEPTSLKQIAVESGYEAQLDLNDAEYPLQCKLPGVDGVQRVSLQMLARIGMEFVSPKWAVLNAIQMLKRHIETVRQEQSKSVET
jgi:hypothetical protein